LVIVNVWIGVAANGINALLHFMLLDVWHLGLNGSALALMLSYVSMFVMTLVYIIISKTYTATWGGWSSQCLHNWGAFIRLSLPGMFMISLETWFFEIGTILAGVLGTRDLGAQSVLIQIDNLYLVIPSGMQIACAIHLGQCLGANKPARAQLSAWICLVFISYYQTYAYTKYVVSIWGSLCREVADLAADLMPEVGTYMAFASLTIVCKGVLSGAGRQAMACAVLLITYYVIALPISVCLVFLTDLGLEGYWIGMTIATILGLSVSLAIVYRTDWPRHADEVAVHT
ncbi:hypothetical protein CAPTEDRAFT_147184, partial [Capitella teleta]